MVDRMSTQDARQDAPEGLASQADVDAEVAALSLAYDEVRAAGGEETQPRLDYAPYRSSLLRHPTKAPVQADPEGVERWAPVFGERDVAAVEADLTVQHDGEPVGERMIVTGRVLDGAGRPVRHQLVELWQANAAGRYVHQRDQHPAPLDPNFTGMGRCLTDDQGRYEFVTIKPGAYPWGNHHNAWRPAHIHVSLFGPAFATRLVTQMYFPGDPLFDQDPIFQSVRDPRDRERLICAFDLERTEPEWALAYRFDIVLRGREATPFED
jgi:protocatechuate 3,4-dioxygenase beta subunit